MMIRLCGHVAGVELIRELAIAAHNGETFCVEPPDRDLGGVNERERLLTTPMLVAINSKPKFVPKG